MTAYFTADLHLGEESVMLRCERPWASIDEHDAAIVANINARVGVDDELYILGDVTAVRDRARLRAWMDAIACKNRWLIWGNHDTDALREVGGFVVCANYLEVVASGHLCCLSHYPMLDWNKGDEYYATHKLETLALMLHGHVHSRGREANAANAQAGIRRYDVGVDANGFSPVSIDEIWSFFATASS